MANWFASVRHHDGYRGPDVELYGDREAGTLAIVLPARSGLLAGALKQLTEGSDRSMTVAVIPENYSPRSQLQAMGLATEHLTTPRAEALAAAHMLKQMLQTGNQLVGLVDIDPGSTLIRNDAALWAPGQGYPFDGFATASAMPLGKVTVANRTTDVSPLTSTTPLAMRWENARFHQVQYGDNASEIGDLADKDQARCGQLLKKIDELTHATSLSRATRAQVGGLGQELARRHDGSIVYREAVSSDVNVASCGSDKAGRMALLAGLGFANTADYVFVLPPTQRATDPKDATYRARVAQNPTYTGAYGSNSLLALSTQQALSRTDEALVMHLPLPVTAIERTREIVAADPRARTAAFVGYGSPEGVAACVLAATAEPLDRPAHIVLPLELNPKRGRAIRAALIKQGVEPDRISLATSNPLIRGLAATAGADRFSAARLVDVWPAAKRLPRRAQAL